MHLLDCLYVLSDRWVITEVALENLVYFLKTQFTKLLEISYLLPWIFKKWITTMEVELNEE